MIRPSPIPASPQVRQVRLLGRLALDRRTTSEGAAVDALAGAYVADAGSRPTIGMMPTGAFWAADEEMFIGKTRTGSVDLEGGAHPQRR